MFWEQISYSGVHCGSLMISHSPIKTIFSPHPGTSSLLSQTHLLFAEGGRLFGGHTRLGTRGPLHLVLPSCSLWAIRQRGTGTWGQGLRRCQEDFAAHLDCPSSVFRGGEATALAQPCQDLRRPECITPGIVPIPAGRKGVCLIWGQPWTQLGSGAGVGPLKT